MSFMFRGASSFNSDITFWTWGNSPIINMQRMFLNATSFNQDISKWDFSQNNSNSLTLLEMFEGATSFGPQPLQYWLLTNISSYTDMLKDTNFTNTSTLSVPTPGADQFNQLRPSEAMDDSNFLTQLALYISTPSAAQFTNQNNRPWYGNISNWNVTAVTNMTGAFQNNTSFNDDITGWDVSNVTNMSNMFNGATSFNQNISSWTVTSLTNASGMFNGATSFNQNIGSWNVTNVTNMSDMFNGAVAFNQNIGHRNQNIKCNKYVKYVQRSISI